LPSIPPLRPVARRHCASSVAAIAPHGATHDPIEHAGHFVAARRSHRTQLIHCEPVRELACGGPQLGVVGVMRETGEDRAE